MISPDFKADLRVFLQDSRDALLWKLEGLSEYDIRRPLTPTGTNLLGLVKHLAGAEAFYFGTVGQRAGGTNMAPGNASWWAQHRDRVEQAAKEAERFNSGANSAP
ncbi:DUF664 domain-containing protein [Streptomyces prunicolor]